jgi:hypothetical protein
VSDEPCAKAVSPRAIDKRGSVCIMGDYGFRNDWLCLNNLWLRTDAGRFTYLSLPTSGVHGLKSYWIREELGDRLRGQASVTNIQASPHIT